MGDRDTNDHLASLSGDKGLEWNRVVTVKTERNMCQRHYEGQLDRSS